MATSIVWRLRTGYGKAPKAPSRAFSMPCRSMGREVLLKLRARGMNAPKLAIGDGAMGFWAALEEIFPTTRQQRCWMHKTMNVLDCLPKTAHPKAKQALHDIWQAKTRKRAHNRAMIY